jgi:DNA-directed RNA polymerase specialized sigma24 family protein
MKKRTEEDTKRAYGLARVMGRRFVQTHPRPVHYMDEDDYTQEAIIAWLENKHIPYKLVDVYRKASPIGRRNWLKNKGLLKLYDPLSIDDMTNALESGEDVEEEVQKRLRLKKIQKIVNDMVDPRQQIIIIMKYAYDLTLAEISKGLNLSKSYMSKLHREALDHIKEEVEKNGDD